MLSKASNGLPGGSSNLLSVFCHWHRDHEWIACRKSVRERFIEQLLATSRNIVGIVRLGGHDRGRLGRLGRAHCVVTKTSAGKPIARSDPKIQPSILSRVVRESGEVRVRMA